MNHQRPVFGLIFLICFVLTTFVLTTVEASAQALTPSGVPFGASGTACGTSDASPPRFDLFLPLDLPGLDLGALDAGVVPGAQLTIDAEVFLGDRVLQRQTYSILAVPEANVLPVWLGGATTREDLGKLAEHAPGEVFLRLAPAGMAPLTIGLESLLAESTALGKGEVRPLLVTSMQVRDVGEAMHPEPMAAAVAAFTCPNAFPFCDIQYDDCLAECPGEGDECGSQCDFQYGYCVNGQTTSSTTKVLSSYSLDHTDCAIYPWWKVWDPNIWNYYNATYQHQTTLYTYCTSTGLTYTTQGQSWTTTDLCKYNTSVGCFDATLDIISGCRWSQPGG